MNDHLGSRADAYLDGHVDDKSRQDIETHLKACASCTAELKSMKTIGHQVKNARPKPQAKSTFKTYWSQLLGRHQEVKTMSAIQRLKRVVESNLHSAIDAMEEPSKMIKQLLREMDAAIQEAREETVQAMILEKGLTHRHDEAAASVKKWEDRAALALKNTREDLAREALQEQLSLEGLVEDLHEESEKQKARVAELKGTFQTLERQYQDLKRRQALWLSQVQQTLGRSHSRQAYQTAYNELGRMLNVTRERAIVDAVYREVSSIETTEETIDAMDQKQILDQRLSVLKKRLQS